MESIRNTSVKKLQSPPNIVSASTPVSKVVGLLRDLNIYQVFFEEAERIQMVTVREVLGVSNITAAKVGSFALHVPKLLPNSTIREAARLMTDYRLRALPIVENGKITGEITAASIINLLKDAANDLASMKAKDIMSPNPITILSDDLVSKARNLMVRRKIDHLPVVSDGKQLKGIVTSSHILFSMVPKEAVELGARGVDLPTRLNFPVKGLMDTSALTCNLDEKLLRLIGQMVSLNVTCTSVMLWEELQGIITYRDIIKLVAGQPEEGDIPLYIIGLPEDPFEAEAAKEKFIRTVKLLRKSFPYIEEANSVIKTSSSAGDKERKRYEVNVSIKTPRRIYKFSEVDWDLPAIYDIIQNRMKRLITKKPKKPYGLKEAKPF